MIAFCQTFSTETWSHKQLSRIPSLLIFIKCNYAFYCHKLNFFQVQLFLAEIYYNTPHISAGSVLRLDTGAVLTVSAIIKYIYFKLALRSGDIRVYTNIITNSRLVLYMYRVWKLVFKITCIYSYQPFICLLQIFGTIVTYIVVVLQFTGTTTTPPCSGGLNSTGT